MKFGAGVTVTRLRAGRVDDGYDGTRPDWTTASSKQIEGCGLAPRVGDEFAQRGREGAEVLWTLYAPHGADITYHDRIRTPDDGVFNVEGDPGEWSHPMTGWDAGTAVALSRVEG